MAVYNVADLQAKYGSNYQAGINAATKAGDTSLAKALTGLRQEKIAGSPDLTAKYGAASTTAPTGSTGTTGLGTTGTGSKLSTLSNAVKNIATPKVSEVPGFNAPAVKKPAEEVPVVPVPEVPIQDQKYTSQFSPEMLKTLATISQRINNPAVYDPNTDTGLQAAQSQVVSAVARAAARRNMLYDTNTLYQQLQDSAALVPGYKQAYDNNQQQQLGNLMQLSQLYRGMDDSDYQRYQNEITNQAQYGGTYKGNKTIDAQQNETTNNAVYGGTYNGGQTYQAKRDTQSDLAQYGGKFFNPETGKFEDTIQKTQMDIENMYRNADYTGYLETPEIKAASTKEIPQEIRDRVARYSASTGGIQAYINTLSPGTPEFVYANRIRNEAILNNPDLFKKFGSTIKNEFGFRTLNGQQLDFTKATQEWEQKFKTEQFTWEKAQKEIENKFQERQVKIQESQLSNETKKMNFDMNMANKQFDLESAKFAYSKAKAASSGSGADGEDYTKSEYYDSTIKGIEDYLSNQDNDGVPYERYMRNPQSVPYQRVASVIANSPITRGEKKTAYIRYGIKPN